MPVMAEDVRHYRVQLSASDRGVQRARREVERLLRDWDLGELADIAVLLVSELLTNVLLHVGPGSRHSLSLAHDAGRLRVEVQDPSPRLPSVRRGSLDDEFGRGLALVECLAHSWGADALPTGKVVWFTLASE
ncbi:ATP-binding protein [Yinghuangia seranimata]|uniref:ATP-binding protein n=1 Tax=Yinghuangia seranimata TaxID=408067 RepID=UPI00248D1613|nr:ATP-binding protein [Yinghuangia seranimata]MDI2125180.1 ATP-binding protein [Yinghuangia seranimata]